jgi:hypothetical protein
MPCLLNYTHRMSHVLLFQYSQSNDFEQIVLLKLQTLATWKRLMPPVDSKRKLGEWQKHKVSSCSSIVVQRNSFNHTRIFSLDPRKTW